MPLSRFPDKPLTSAVAVLDVLKRGDWLAQYKFDGWRAVVETGEADDGSDWRFTSRHNKPLPVSADLRRDLGRWSRAAWGHCPPHTLFDGEWMARRAGNALGEERLWLFDVLRFGRDDWQLGRTAEQRFDALLLHAPAPLIVPYTFWRDDDEPSYRAMFDASKADPRTEGIVLKRRSSTYIGSTRGCADNPGWMKVKWRDGSDGLKRIA